MRIALERRSSKAVYLQIRDRIRGLIQTGALQPGDKLPPRVLREAELHRKLAPPSAP